MPSTLFTPFRMAGLELANRIVVSPMCQYSADDGCANDWHLMHLGMMAHSGAALVVVEATHVERHGRITHGCLGLYSDDNEAALARVVRQARRMGSAKFGIQIAHSGRKGSAQRPWEGAGALKPDADPWPTIAASPIPFGEGWHTPREVTEADMDRVRSAFVASVQRALRIGFDEIELHMAHGYLIHGFMSPISNKRSDQYGGSLENRLRFPLSIARAVRAVVPNTVALGARITGSDWREGGLTPDDAVAIARALKGEGLDFICISSGGVAGDIRNPDGARLQRAHCRAREKRGGHSHPDSWPHRETRARRGHRGQGSGGLGVNGALLPRRSALGLACGQGLGRRGRAAAAISARGSQTVGAGGCKNIGRGLGVAVSSRARDRESGSSTTFRVNRG